MSWPSPKAATNTIQLTVKDFTTGLKIPNVNVAVCSPIDLDCSQSYAQGETNENGQATLQFPRVLNFTQQLGLDGYLQLTSPTLAASRYYWGFPLVEAQVALYTEAFTLDELQQFFLAAHVTQNPMRGSLATVVEDCLQNPAPGVQVTLSNRDMLTQELGFTGSPETETDQFGIAIFTNVPAGPLVLTATPLATGKVSSTVSVNVVAGGQIVAVMWPTP